MGWLPPTTRPKDKKNPYKTSKHISTHLSKVMLLTCTGAKSDEGLRPGVGKGAPCMGFTPPKCPDSVPFAPMRPAARSTCHQRVARGHLKRWEAKQEGASVQCHCARARALLFRAPPPAGRLTVAAAVAQSTTHQHDVVAPFRSPPGWVQVQAALVFVRDRRARSGGGRARSEAPELRLRSRGGGGG